MCRPFLKLTLTTTRTRNSASISPTVRVDEDSFDQVGMSLSRIGKRWSAPLYLTLSNRNERGDAPLHRHCRTTWLVSSRKASDLRPRLVDAMSVDRGRLMRRLRVISDSGRGVHYAQETFRKQFLIPLPRLIDDSPLCSVAAGTTGIPDPPVNRTGRRPIFTPAAQRSMSAPETSMRSMTVVISDD